MTPAAAAAAEDAPGRSSGSKRAPPEHDADGPGADLGTASGEVGLGRYGAAYASSKQATSAAAEPQSASKTSGHPAASGSAPTAPTATTPKAAGAGGASVVPAIPPPPPRRPMNQSATERSSLISPKDEEGPSHQSGGHAARQ